MKKRISFFLLISILLIILNFSSWVTASAAPWQVSIWGLDKQSNKMKLVSLEKIKKIPPVTLKATLRKSDGTVQTNNYTGVSLKEFLKYTGLKNDFKSVQIVAKDSYLIELDKNLASKKGTIFAYLKDGRRLSEEDGGPLQLVVSGETGMYWVRQVDKIIVKR